MHDKKRKVWNDEWEERRQNKEHKLRRDEEKQSSKKIKFRGFETFDDPNFDEEYNDD